jgi:ParB/RepB/Spo0J family partition protein
MQNSSAFQYLAIDTIHESATNPGRTFDEIKLQELAASIKHHGLIQPITVRPESQGFEVMAGARRFRAAQLAELFSVPARIVEIDGSARFSLYDLQQAKLVLDAAHLDFLRKAAPWVRRSKPRSGPKPGTNP